ncbi:MAG: hypothetical protein K2K20_13795 [Lachnospiraceae bacterium]|nr:hypothetical protein [Lachnospiraceae bacterium]
MKRSGYKKRNGWKGGLLAMLAVFLLCFNKITVQGAGMVSGDGDFVIWYLSSIAETWIRNIYAGGQSDILDRITFVYYYDYYDYLEDLNEILSHPEDPLYPDLIFLEPDYAAGFLLEGELLLSADDLGITDTDMSNMFPFTIANGTDAQGAVRTFYCSVSPGAYQVRADLAETYLGTSNAAELHDRYFCDWKSMMAAARKVYIESGGMVALFPGYGELYAGLAMPGQDFSWVDENGVTTDAAQIGQMMRLTRGFERYTLGAQQWTLDWVDAMDGDGIQTPAAITYAGSPWFTGFCLSDSWRNNTVIVEGPVGFQWGGNGLAATAGCSDVDFAADIIRTLCCDVDAMTEMAGGIEFVNNREALVSAGALGYGDCDYLYNQSKDLFQVYRPLAEKTSGNRLTPYDWAMNDLYEVSLGQFMLQGGGVEESIELGEELIEALNGMMP